jgi:hypothetical protein
VVPEAGWDHVTMSDLLGGVSMPEGPRGKEGIFRKAPGQPESDVPGVPSGKSTGPKATDIDSVSALLEFAYAQQGRQVKVPQATFKLLSGRRELTDSDRDTDLECLLDLAAGDPLLMVPPRLLSAVEASNESRLLRRRLIHLLTEVLRVHPIFRSEKAQRLLAGDSADVDEAFVSVACTCADLTAIDLNMASNGFRDSEREKLRFNAITSLALLAAARDEWLIGELVERLELHLWRYSAKRAGTRLPRVAVTEPPNLDSLAVVADVFMNKANVARQAVTAADERAVAAERHVAIANERAVAAEAITAQRVLELADRNSEIAALREQIRILESEIEAERRDRVIDRSHHIDDYEKLKTRVTRVLVKQIDLLTDGLHALRHGSSSITDEYIERSVNTLNEELVQLRDRGD